MLTAGLTPFLILLAAASARGGELHAKASPAASPCVLAVKPLYEATLARKLVLETARLEGAESAIGADVVVGAEGELTRIIEGGASHPELEVDLATIPWVLVTANPQGPSDLQALAASPMVVRVLGGSVGLAARRALQHLPAERVRTFTDPAGSVELAEGEAAVIPLSLAGRGRLSRLDIPSLLVRAVGVRASTNLEAARQFLEFLTRGLGNAAFRRCGRETPP
jgi:hypothetical protein